MIFLWIALTIDYNLCWSFRLFGTPFCYEYKGIQPQVHTCHRPKLYLLDKSIPACIWVACTALFCSYPGTFWRIACYTRGTYGPRYTLECLKKQMVIVPISVFWYTIMVETSSIAQSLSRKRPPFRLRSNVDELYKAVIWHTLGFELKSGSSDPTSVTLLNAKQWTSA